MKLTLAQLAERLGAELIGSRGEIGKLISSVGPVEAASESDVTFVTNDKHKHALKSSQAGAAIVAGRIEGLSKPQLVVDNVDTALIEALNIFAPRLRPAAAGVDSTAKLGQDVKIAKSSSVGPNVVIDDKVEIGENSIISSGCKIGENSRLGKNCRLDCNVVIYHNCCLGNNVIIQANSTIGSTGFGYSFIDGAHKLIPHNGGVVIEDFVEIGANCCVDRAKFANTVIGAGTKIDNLVQIAHNVVIGKCCLIASLVGISGSCKLGDGVALAGQVGLTNNIEIGDGTIVGAQAGVMNDVPAGQKLVWSPAIDSKEALRVLGTVIRLPKLARQLKQMDKRIEKLEASEDDKKRRQD